MRSHQTNFMNENIDLPYIVILFLTEGFSNEI